jgi:hypothetical protein
MTGNIYDWAQRWGIPASAMADLVQTQFHTTGQLSREIESESALQSLVRLEAAKKDIHLWRNNVGVLLDKKGRPVRYGLANDSAAVNEVVKSADLIGIRKVLIKPDHVGSIFGQFVSRECKRPDWTYTGTPEELAQLRWSTLINASGGDAAMVNSEGSL